MTKNLTYILVVTNVIYIYIFDALAFTVFIVIKLY